MPSNNQPARKQPNMNRLRYITAGLFLLLQAMQAPATPSPARPQSSTPLPAAMPLDRYKALIERSPFAVASETAPAPVVDVAGFSKDLVLTGAVRLGTDYYITLASRVDPTLHMGIKSGEPYNGISVASVAWSDAIGKTKVTLKSGNEFGVVSFDEAVINTPSAPPPAPVPLASTGRPIPPRGVTPPNPNPGTPNAQASMGTPNIPGAYPSGSPYTRRRIIRSSPATQ
jgi:hypothetical protein